MSKELLDQPVSGPMTPEFIAKVRDAVLWEVTVWQSRPPESEALHFRRQGQFGCSGKSCDLSSACRPAPRSLPARERQDLCFEALPAAPSDRRGRNPPEFGRAPTLLAAER